MHQSFRNWSRNALGLVAILFVAIIGVMRGNAIPTGGGLADGPHVIWGISVALLAVGFARGAIDMSRLRGEWRAIDVLSKNIDGVLTAVPDSVVAARVRAVNDARLEERADHDFRSTQRDLAASQLGAIGAVTKVLSSSLLVLAVLGTFAGMRSAMPDLTRAISNATVDGVSQAESAIQPALKHVADALGSNFIALLGSLVLTIIAFAASLERRGVLTSIETESERGLYRRLPVDADATELQRAVEQLRHSVQIVGGVMTSVQNLDRGIGDLGQVMKDTMREMRESFSDTIRAVGSQQQQQLNQAIRQIGETLGTTSVALQTTATAYEGLVRGLEERDLGVRAAATSLDEASRAMSAAQGTLSVSASDASAASTRALSLLDQIGTITGKTLTDVQAGMQTVAAGSSEQRRLLEGIANILNRTAEAHSSELVDLRTRADQLIVVQESLSGVLRTQLAAHGTVLQASQGSLTALAASGTQHQELLQRIADSIVFVSDGQSQALNTLGDKVEQLNRSAGVVGDTMRSHLEAQVVVLQGAIAANAERLTGPLTRIDEGVRQSRTDVTGAIDLLAQSVGAQAALLRELQKETLSRLSRPAESTNAAGNSTGAGLQP